MTRLALPLLVLCLTAVQAAEEKAGFPSLMGRRVAIVLSDKGRPVDRIDAAFADGAMTAPWLAKQGFSSPARLDGPTYDGKNNKRTSYGLTQTNDKGDTLTITLTLYDAKNGGDLNGQVGIVRADGTVRNWALLAEKVVTETVGDQKRKAKEGDGK